MCWQGDQWLSWLPLRLRQGRITNFIHRCKNKSPLKVNPAISNAIDSMLFGLSLHSHHHTTQHSTDSVVSWSIQR